MGDYTTALFGNSRGALQGGAGMRLPQYPMAPAPLAPAMLPGQTRMNPSGMPRNPYPIAPPQLMINRSNPGIPRAGYVPPTPAGGPPVTTPTPAGAFSPSSGTYGPPAIGNYGVSATAPHTAAGSYGTVVAGAGQSYLPFEMNYLSGASPTGGNYAANYISPESAGKLNEYLAAMGLGGGQVIQGPSYGLPGQSSPGEYQIRLQNGQTLDAGGLANILSRYSPQDAATRINNSLNAPPASSWGAGSRLNPQTFGDMKQWFAGAPSPFQSYVDNPNANTPPSWYTAGTGAPAGTAPGGPPPDQGGPAAPTPPAVPGAPPVPSATGGNGAPPGQGTSQAQTQYPSYYGSNQQNYGSPYGPASPFGAGYGAAFGGYNVTPSYQQGSTPDQALAQQSGDMGYLQGIAANAGYATNTQPAWQAMIDAQQQQLGKNRADLAEQYNVQGGRFSSAFGQGMQQFENQAQLDQSSLLGQLTMQAQESARQRELQASGQLGGFAQQGLSQLSAQNYGAQQQQMQAALQASLAASGGADTASNLMAQYGSQAALAMLGGSNQGAEALYGGQQQYLGNAMNYDTALQGLGLGAAGQYNQALNQNLQMGMNLGQQQFGMDSYNIGNRYQEYLRTQPGYNPLLNLGYASATNQPQVYMPGYQPSTFSQLTNAAMPWLQMGAQYGPGILDRLGLGGGIQSGGGIPTGVPGGVFGDIYGGMQYPVPTFPGGAPQFPGQGSYEGSYPPPYVYGGMPPWYGGVGATPPIFGWPTDNPLYGT